MNLQSLELRQQILDLVRQYHDVTFDKNQFVPGSSPVPVSGRTFDAHDLEMLVDSSLDFWLTTGRFAEIFSRQLAKQFGLRHCVLTNSGSSANLLALSCLTSPQSTSTLPDEPLATQRTAIHFGGRWSADKPDRSVLDLQVEEPTAKSSRVADHRCSDFDDRGRLLRERCQS